MMAGIAVGLVAVAAVLLTLPTGDASQFSAAGPTQVASDSVEQHPPVAAAAVQPATIQPPPAPAPPPPPAVVANGSINASSLPRGAVLHVDGKPISRRRVNLPAGRHFLVVALDGYATRTDTVTVLPAQTLRFAPHLEPLRPTKTVAARPMPVAPPVEPPSAPPARRGNPDEAACRQAMAAAAWRDAYAACGRAAQGGSASAQRSIGMLFQNGNGVRRSDDSAARWFIQGAHGGDTEAQYQLAMAYEHGHGVPRNQGAALDWYTRAATAGAAAAQLVVGEAYEKGHLGLAKDKRRALEWYRKAAAQGNKDAANKVRDLER
jgi:Sel1 repeat-containing protein/PEGA domain-containing protein